MALFWEVLATPGLWWVAIGAFLAGTVRGFAGFGTGMIYLPFAATVLSPVGALLSLAVMDSLGPLPVIPSTARTAPRKPLLLMIAGMIVCLPIGLFALAQMEPTTYRWILAILTFCAVVLMIGGYRFPGEVNNGIWLGTGGAVGILGGGTGLPGPPIVLVTMASRMSPASIRALNMVLLFVFDLVLFPTMWLQGMFGIVPFVTGVVMVVPFLVGLGLGCLIFHPEKEKMYRGVAYAVITFAAATALPIWGN